MLELTSDWFRERYREMTEAELMDYARKYDQLTELAQSALRDEFESRELEPPLVEEDSEELHQRELVTVAKYRDMPEALVARSVLEAESIECFLADENTVRMDWLWSNLIGGMRLQVDVEDAERAREVLSQPMPETIAFDEDQNFDQPLCPACGSLRVISDDADRKVLAMSLLVSVPLPHKRPTENKLRCQDCGLRWEDNAV